MTSALIRIRNMLWRRLTGGDLPPGPVTRLAALPRGGAGEEGFGAPEASAVLPAVPEYALGLFARDTALDGRARLDALTVLWCIHNVFREWQSETGYFPELARADLNRLRDTYAAGLATVPHDYATCVPIDLVEDCVRQYVAILRRDRATVVKFKRSAVTPTALAMDVAGTIGAGPAIAALLDTPASALDR